MPFLFDMEAQTRFLVALPLLISRRAFCTQTGAHASGTVHRSGYYHRKRTSEIPCIDRLSHETAKFRRHRVDSAPAGLHRWALPFEHGKHHGRSRIRRWVVVCHNR